jgi:hypothetical protein
MQNDDDDEQHEICAYCDAEVDANSGVPKASDDEAWGKIAEHHSVYCEWVLTRAHRVTDDTE